MVVLEKIYSSLNTISIYSIIAFRAYLEIGKKCIKIEVNILLISSGVFVDVINS